MKEMRCSGCGSILQSTDKNQPGYVPVIKENILCQRCFKFIHYHEYTKSNMSKDDYLSILSDIGNKDCLIIYVLDLFDFHGSFIQGINRHVGYNDILVLANKRDILPKSLNDNRLKDYVKKELKKEGVYSKDIFITSALKQYQFDDIYDAMMYYSKGRDIYIIGQTNSGKSTFLNHLLIHYSNVSTMITTSEFPGTTLNLIQIQMSEQASIYDTPGIIDSHRMITHVNKKDLKYLIPTSEIRPIAYQIQGGQTIFIEGLVTIDYVIGEKAGFHFYVSNRLKLHRTKTINKDKISKQMNLCPLDKDNTKVYEFSLDGHKTEIEIYGVGFFSTKAKGKICIEVIKDVNVIRRDCLI